MNDYCWFTISKSNTINNNSCGMQEFQQLLRRRLNLKLPLPLADAQSYLARPKAAVARLQVSWQRVAAWWCSWWLLLVGVAGVVD